MKCNKSALEGSLFRLDSDPKVKADGTSVLNSFHLKSCACVFSACCFWLHSSFLQQESLKPTYANPSSAYRIVRVHIQTSTKACTGNNALQSLNWSNVVSWESPQWHMASWDKTQKQKQWDVLANNPSKQCRMWSSSSQLTMLLTCKTIRCSEILHSSDILFCSC